jgi:polysaccharide export outer membrane protein
MVWKKDVVMNTKARIFTVALLCLGTIIFVRGQNQQQQTPVPGQPSSIDSQGLRNYLLGPGDVLDVRVLFQPDLNAVAEVDSQGNITSLPFLEAPIRAQCRVEKDVAKDIVTAYSKYVKNPQVSVRIVERKSRQPATVYGAVRNPMRVEMLRRARLHELLASAGGVTERASGTIQIVHTESEMCPESDEVVQQKPEPSGPEAQLEVYRIADLRMGKEEADPYIRPGDVVIVSEGEPVYVTGAVIAPQGIYMRDKLTLGRAVAMVGGPAKFANTSEVHIYRQTGGEAGQEDIKVNYDAIRKGKQEDVLLKPYDIIDIRESGAFSKSRWVDTLVGAAKNSVGVFSNTLSYRVLY